MMIYKLATKQLRDSGINHIVIVKALFGAAVQDKRAAKQTTFCFENWQEARDAVLNGYRPTIERWKDGFGNEQ